MLPDFNRLKVFYHIYASNSIVGAARKLHLSQPAVSQQLQKLEAELKVPLFTRLHKKLIPTAAGSRLFSIVKPFVEDLQVELPLIRQPLDRPSGNLRIGAPKEFGKEFLPQFCHSFREGFPDVTFTLKFEEASPLMSMLQAGDLDFALVDVFQRKGEFLGNPDIFSVETLIREELVLACSASYYQQEINGDHSYRNLISKDFLSDEDDLAILKHWFRHHFNKTVPDLNVVMMIDSHEALISGVKLGMGMGVISAHLVWTEIGNASIVPIVTSRKNVVNRISLIQLQDKIPTLTEKTFLAHLHQGMRKPEVLQKFDLVSGQNIRS
jgi:DNA-binding transcriptional LysR family regulator